MPQRGLKRPFVLGLIACLCAFGARSADENPVGAMQELMLRWIALEQQANTLKSNWRRQQPVLEQQLFLLDKEEEELSRILEESQSVQDEAEERRPELLEEEANLQQQQLALEQALNVVTLDLERIHGQLPPPVHDAWSEDLPKLRGELLSTNERVQLVLRLLAQLEDFQDKVTLHEAIIPSDDGPYLVRQVYLGLSHGWYVSADRSRAAHGHAGRGEWQWEPSADAETIAAFISMVEGAEPARLLSVPIELATPAASAGANQ